MSIGYHNIPRPLADSVVRLKYLRVCDNRDISSKSGPSPLSLWYLITLTTGYTPPHPHDHAPHVHVYSEQPLHPGFGWAEPVVASLKALAVVEPYSLNVRISLKIKHLQSDKNLVDVERRTVECLLHVSHLGNLTCIGNTVSVLKCWHMKYRTSEELHVQKRLIQWKIVHERKPNATGWTRRVDLDINKNVRCFRIILEDVVQQVVDCSLETRKLVLRLVEALFLPGAWSARNITKKKNVFTDFTSFTWSYSSAMKKHSPQSL